TSTTSGLAVRVPTVANWSFPLTAVMPPGTGGPSAVLQAASNSTASAMGRQYFRRSIDLIWQRSWSTEVRPEMLGTEKSKSRACQKVGVAGQQPATIRLTTKDAERGPCAANRLARGSRD